MAKQTSIDKAIKATRMNSEVPKAEATAVLGEMAKRRGFMALAKKVRNGEAKLMAKRVIIANFPRKYICVCFDKTKVPITKAKLYGNKKVRACKHCNRTNCHRSKSLSTLRKSIAIQISEYKQEVKQKAMSLASNNTPAAKIELHSLTHCAISGIPLAAGQVHVDHVYPFSYMVDDWLSQNNYEQTFLCNNKLWVKANRSVTDNWFAYHKENAMLQLVSAKANLKKSNKLT